jgi:hypothetical protein
MGTGEVPFEQVASQATRLASHDLTFMACPPQHPSAAEHCAVALGMLMYRH